MEVSSSLAGGTVVCGQQSDPSHVAHQPRPSHKMRDAQELPSQNALQNDPDFVEDDTVNDLVRNLGLSKSKAELLASRKRGWKLLQGDTKVSFFRQRLKEFEQLFSKGFSAMMLRICSSHWVLSIILSIGVYS